MPGYTVQRLQGRYAIVWRDDEGKRHRFRLAAQNRPDAEAEARSWWQGATSEPWTVGRIVEAYIQDRERAGIASSSRQRNAWKAMGHYWHPVDPAMIDDDMARAYAKQRDRSPATVRYELSMLAVALRWADKAGHIDRAPQIWRPPAPERKKRHLTRAEFRTWYEGVKAPHARLYVILAVTTMARPTAILELKWEQVDFERALVDLNPRGRGQTKKRRPVVPLNDDALEALREAYEARQCEYVIERGAKPVKSMKKAFQAASARTGVKATPYMLRHTGAVWAAEGGASMAELAQFMGHDDDSTTQKHYARYSPDYLRGVASKVRVGVE